jgi:hypothetical protein
MQQYLTYLIADITKATQSASFPYVEKELSIHNWVSAEEEEHTAQLEIYVSGLV